MDKPEALRLADALDAWDGKFMMPKGWREHAAAELRRLAAVEAQRDALLEALKLIATTDFVISTIDPQRVVRIARAAIAKAEEQE